jgi:hypothetical protein
MKAARTLALATLPALSTLPTLLALLLAALLSSLFACDPAYEPPPKPPPSVYIPWQAGPARGRPRRAAPTPTTGTAAAPSAAPSVELEDVDDEPDAAVAGDASD